jgi:hypothetical protein
MSHKERPAYKKAMIAETGLTYATANTRWLDGRLSDSDWDAYRHVWRNSAFRWSSMEEDQQHRTEADMLACQLCQDMGLKFDPIAAMPDNT